MSNEVKSEEDVFAPPPYEKRVLVWVEGHWYVGTRDSTSRMGEHWTYWNWTGKCNFTCRNTIWRDLPPAPGKLKAVK